MSLGEGRKKLDEVYAAYQASAAARSRRDPSGAGNIIIARERDDWWAMRLRQHAGLCGRPLRVLDVGCGPGGRLRWARQELGPDALLVGVDLLWRQVREVDKQTACPLEADATKLPFGAGSFDVALLSTVMSSILDRSARVAVAAEVMRVLRPPAGTARTPGLILWYDMRLPNPVNPNVAPVRRRELFRLFPSAEAEIASVTVLPPLTRLLAERWPAVLTMLARAPFLRSHWVAAIRVEGGS